MVVICVGFGNFATLGLIFVLKVLAFLIPSMARKLSLKPGFMIELPTLNLKEEKAFLTIHAVSRFAWYFESVRKIMFSQLACSNPNSIVNPIHETA